MQRNAFKMQLKPGYEAEYKKRHDEIWPELAEELSKAGVSDYSIFLDEQTLTLFAVQKLSDDNTADELPETAIVKKVVGLHGRYHGYQSRQLAGLHTAAGSFSPGLAECLSAKPVKPKSFRLGAHGEGLTILWCGVLAWRHNPQGIVGGASTRLLYI